MKPRFLILVAGLALLSCGEKPHTPETAGPELTVLIGTDGYGDGCYNDVMLSGILAFCEKHPEVRLSLQQPENIADAGKRLDGWLAAKSEGERALILASNSYEPILRGKPAPKNGRVLILETDERFPGHSSYIIRRYGASWLCGAMSDSFTPVILKAMDGNDMIDESTRGFTEGYGEVSDEVPFTWTLADGPEGFAMRDSTYRYLYKHLYEDVYPNELKGLVLIFPLLGGSLPGVFDYSRYNGFVAIAGMDTDCSAFNPNVVPYSMTVHNDRVLEGYLEDWLSGTPWPEHTTFGLESGYINVMIHPKYPNLVDHMDFQAIYQEFYPRALEKEKAYEAE